MGKMIGSVALDKCDKYDYYASAFSGIAAGLVDVFFVGAPGEGTLGKFTDNQTDNIVMKCAKFCGWNPRDGNGDISKAIDFLEKKFPVNYDLQYANYSEYGFNMAPNNHHIKSLAHSPDPIGLLFSIVDQFYGQSTFVSDGRLISIRTETMELQGDNLVAKIFCGFCNWLGHLLSDVAGSSNRRRVNIQSRGSGIPIPFFNMFLACDFGSFQIEKDREGKTFAEVMTRVFEEGYDLRYAGAMAIPVILNELFVRAFWAIKRHFYHGLEWKDCIPSVDRYRSLHKMLLVSNACLCIVDGIDAYIRSGGNILTFILRLNLVAWGRLLVLIWKYLTISRAKLEYERNHAKNVAIIQAIEKETLELKAKLKEFLEEQQLVIDKNMAIVIHAIDHNDFDMTSEALNNIVGLFGQELQFTTFEEFDEFMLDPDTVFEL